MRNTSNHNHPPAIGSFVSTFAFTFALTFLCVVICGCGYDSVVFQVDAGTDVDVAVAVVGCDVDTVSVGSVIGGGTGSKWLWPGDVSRWLEWTKRCGVDTGVWNLVLRSTRLVMHCSSSASLGYAGWWYLGSPDVHVTMCGPLHCETAGLQKDGAFMGRIAGLVAHELGHVALWRAGDATGDATHKHVIEYERCAARLEVEHWK